MSERTRNLVVLAAAVVVAAASARPFADSANDGSRLAVVESVVDHGTLSIDESIFVRVPADRPPYPDHHDKLLEIGTIDRIRVGDRYYSDKPYTLSLYLAGCYWLVQRATGLVARDDPALFCYLMNLFSSGVAYVAAVWCVWRLGGVVGLEPRWQTALVVVFGLGTLALPYCQHVNSHILGLAVASAIMLHLARFSSPSPTRGEGEERIRLPMALLLGTLAGLGYAIEQGVGQLLWGWTGLLVLYRGGLRGGLVYVAGSLPWLTLHHAINYKIGGTLGPANAVPAYFEWPGSPFTAANLTGIWNHPTPWHFFPYAAGLLFSDRGFFCYNLPVLLAVPAAVLLWGHRTAPRPELLLAIAWPVSTWLLYAALSTNFSGSCLSIRWFVPLLAPGFYLLALLLRHFPSWRRDFLLLGGWALLEGALMWHTGTWWWRVSLFWPLMAAVVVTWGALLSRTRVRRT